MAMNSQRRIVPAFVALVLAAAVALGGATAASAGQHLSPGLYSTQAKCKAVRAAFVADYRTVTACYLQDGWTFSYDVSSRRY